MNAVNAILSGELPEKGTVLTPDKALCDTCALNDSKPEKLAIDEVKRVSLVEVDPEKCYLAQGIICMGPATRSGCGERCINANMPCRGCFGPTKAVKDQGAKFLSAFASLITSNEEEEIQKLMDSVLDPAGLFYMYSLPKSILQRRKMEATNG